MQIVMTVEERMLSKINKTNYCWLWTDKPDKDGYGHLNVDRKTPSAHRLAYQLWVGPIPEDKPFVCHHCDNPPCVNPEHLYAGTAKENAQDRDSRGRYISGQSNKTHCIKGHEYNEENTYIRKNKRKCRTCHRIEQKAYREANKEAISSRKKLNRQRKKALRARSSK